MFDQGARPSCLAVSAMSSLPRAATRNEGATAAASQDVHVGLQRQLWGYNGLPSCQGMQARYESGRNLVVSSTCG